MKFRLLRLVAILIILSLFITSTTIITASAEEPQYAPSYLLYNAFMRDSYPEISNGARMYLMTVESCESQNWLNFINQGWLLDSASWVLGEDLDTDRCIKILSNIVTMANYQLEAGITMQASENTRQQVIDFALDSVSVVTNLVGMDNALDEVIRSIPTVTSIAADTLELTVDSIEELELLNQLLGDYTMQYNFLTAVASNADLESMRAAAKTLLQANEQILMYKLDTFSNIADVTAKFLAEDIFIDKVAEEMLKDPANFSSESTMFAASLVVGAYKLYTPAKFAFEFTILIGDGLFGTKNQYQQYNEMKAMRDIRTALIKSIDNNIVSGEADRQGMEKNIGLLKIIQYVDAWGETCLYTSAKNEGTFIGDIWPRDTSIMERNCQAALDYFSSRVELLDSIYIDVTPVIDTDPPEPITEEDRLNALCEGVEKKIDGYCKWLAEGDFDEDDDTEVYAFVCDDDDDYKNGAVWYLSRDDKRCLFWLTRSEGDFFLSVVENLSATLAVKAIGFAEYIFDILSDL